MGTARFLPNSRSCTSPRWLRCDQWSCVGLEKQRCEATGSFLPSSSITIYKSGCNLVLLPQHPFSFLSYVLKFLFLFKHLSSACVSSFPCLHISAMLLIVNLWYSLLGKFDILLGSAQARALDSFCQAQEFPKRWYIYHGSYMSCSKSVSNTGLNQDLALPVMLLPLMQHWWLVKKYIKIKSVLCFWSRIWRYFA